MEQFLTSSHWRVGRTESVTADHHTTLPITFVSYLCSSDSTHPQGVTQGLEVLVVWLQFIPVQLPAVCGPYDERKSEEHRLTHPIGFQGPGTQGRDYIHKYQKGKSGPSSTGLQYGKWVPLNLKILFIQYIRNSYTLPVYATAGFYWDILHHRRITLDCINNLCVYPGITPNPEGVYPCGV